MKNRSITINRWLARLVLGVSAALWTAQARACPGATDEPGYHVAQGGHDEADGSTQHPFATLQRAVDAMRQSSQHTTYLEPGSLSLDAPVILDVQDSGTSLLTCPGGNAALDGRGALANLIEVRGAANVRLEGMTLSNTDPGGAGIFLNGARSVVIRAVTVTNAGAGVVLVGATGNTVASSRFLGLRLAGIEAKDASDGNVFDANVIDGVDALETKGGGIFLHGANANTISRNLIQNTMGMGIGVLNWDVHTVNRGNVVTRNIVRDADLSATDSGSIYVLGRSRIDTEMVISGNLVDGTGSASTHSVGVYLDDSTSGVLVTANIIRRIGSDGVQIHGGSDNDVIGNIIDLGAGTPSAVLFQSAPLDTNPDNRMLNNRVRRNIIVSSSDHPRTFAWFSGGAPDIAANLYFASTGAAMITRAPTEDRMPYYGDPRFQAPERTDYKTGEDTAAALIGFLPIPSAGPSLADQ